MSPSPRSTLRTLAERKAGLVVPGAYDGVSARLVERTGFEAVYMTGYGTSASRLGLPDLGFAGLAEMVENVRLEKPCLFNYAPTGRSPLLPVARLRALGYAIVLLPVQTLFAAAHAMAGYLTALRRTGEPGGLDDHLTSFADFNALVGVPEMLERERRLRGQERASG